MNEDKTRKMQRGGNISRQEKLKHKHKHTSKQIYIKQQKQADKEAAWPL